MWVLVSQPLWAHAEHLPYAHHDCLLGFHIHCLFGLLHLKECHNKPSTWIWYTNPKGHHLNNHHDTLKTYICNIL